MKLTDLSYGFLLYLPNFQKDISSYKSNLTKMNKRIIEPRGPIDPRLYKGPAPIV